MLQTTKHNGNQNKGGKMKKENQIEWIAVCMDCKKELERCANGNFAEGAARNHVRNSECNRVVVGYEVKNDGFKARIETMRETFVYPLRAKTYGDAYSELFDFVENRHPDYLSAKLL